MNALRFHQGRLLIAMQFRSRRTLDTMLQRAFVLLDEHGRISDRLCVYNGNVEFHLVNFF